ncbi:exonuclease domain-containing protein [Paucibacter sp. O1-1]|nr:exonuclease domain-containing protein [Paucibacter sp. O1-1]MDA3827988.1 exonuclease domain-containing protein [Paucibacter sp. O1-1]
MTLANQIVVLDFETTGLSPDNGDRAIEIGAVKLVDGQIVDSFQELINPGKRVNSFIEQYTGISNNMLQTCAII